MSGTIVSGSIDNQVRFESMRSHGSRMAVFHRPMHQNRVFRRHLDLDRECQRKVKMYAKEARLLTNKISRIQKEVQDKQKELETLDQPDVTSGGGVSGGGVSGGAVTLPQIHNKHQVVVAPPKLHKEKKNVLLFKIRHVAGKKLYIKEAEKQPSISVRLKV